MGNTITCASVFIVIECTVWHLHRPPEPCSCQHGLRGNRAPSPEENGSGLVWICACPESEVLIKGNICITLWARQEEEEE